MNSNIPATVILSCLHTFQTYIRPREGDVLYCGRCDEWKPWTSTTFSVYLHCDSCKYQRGRGYGGQMQAEASAIRHSMKYRGHRSTVIINGEEHASFYYEPDTLADIPPF